MQDVTQSPHEIEVPITLAGEWPKGAKDAFRFWGPTAVYLIGTASPRSGRVHRLDGSVSSAWGGDHGVRECAIGTTMADPWTAKFESTQNHGPERLRLYWRLWMQADQAAWVLNEMAATLKRMSGGVMRERFYCLPHDVQLGGLIYHAQTVAAMVTNRALDDGGLRRACIEHSQASERRTIARKTGTRNVVKPGRNGNLSR